MKEHVGLPGTGNSGSVPVVAPATDTDDSPTATYLATLEELTALLLEQAPLDAVLAHVLELTSRAITTSAAVSVTVVDDGGGMTTAAASSADATAVDALQYELVEGPCVEALRDGEPRYAADLTADERWPAGRKRATTLGFHSVLAVPLAVNGTTIGALNVFAGEVGGLTEQDHELAHRIAAPAAAILANARAYRRVSRLAEQLEQALTSRVVIEQAKGVIMVQESCTPDDAFELLRRTSQHANKPLREIARRVVEGVAPASGGPA